MTLTSIKDRVALNYGVNMPWLGLGVFRVEDQSVAVTRTVFEIPDKRLSKEGSRIL